jgi:lipopolysaccharide biosynthesis glycosyltransferase
VQAGEAPDDAAIHLALTFDDNFWAPAFAVMRSVCVTTRRRRDLVFHLFLHGVSAAHKADFERIVEEFGVRLLFYDIAGDAELRRIAALLPQNSRFPPIVSARLYIDRFLPASVRRFIYLDSDTLVMAPIERLYDHDLAGFPLAAVADPFALREMGRDMTARHGILDPADGYFNSGVLLIDVGRYTAADVPAQIDEFERRGILGRLFYDQDILNLVFARNWLKLDWRFNVVKPQEAHHASGVYIAHFVSRRRPWHLLPRVPFHHTYRHMMTNELFYRYARYRWQRAASRMVGGLFGRS